MSNSNFARISITLPRELLAAADRAARRLDRSRSWVVAEAVRRYMARDVAELPQRGRAAQAVTEGAAVPYATGLGAYRSAQLEADLALTPEQRVREAEQTARVAELTKPRRRGHHLQLFDQYEDYLDWKRRELTP